MKLLHVRALSVLAAGCLTSLSVVASAADANPAGGPAPIAPAPAANPAADTATTVPTVATSEDDARGRAENTVYVEGLGAGLLYSVNYERLVIEDLAVRGGFGYWSATVSAGDASSSSSVLTLPVTASYLGIGSKKHILELGGGMTFAIFSGAANSGLASASGDGMSILTDALLGYRLHPVDGAGFNFRVGGMAMMGKGLSLSTNDPEAFGVVPWFYLSMGGSF